MKKSHSIDMCNGSLADKLLFFALPLMASSLLQLLFNAADVVVVGWFAGKEALAAVGSNTALINLLINLFVGLSVGTNVVVSRDLGAGRYDNVGRSVHTAMTLALASGTALMVLGVLMVRQLLEWTSSPTDVIDLATVYSIFWACLPTWCTTSVHPSSVPREIPSAPCTSSPSPEWSTSFSTWSSW